MNSFQASAKPSTMAARIPRAARGGNEAIAEDDSNDSVMLGGFAALLVGVALLPHVFYTLVVDWSVGVSGESFAFGPYGLELVACTTTVCLTFWSLGNFVLRGRGLPAGPLGLLGLAEGLSYLATLGLASAAIASSFRSGGVKFPEVPSVASIKAPELPSIKVPDVKAPDFKVPEFKKPDIPEFKAPDIKVPEIKKPDIKVPELKVPDVKVPEVKLPDVKVPDIKVPDVKLPSAPKPKLEAAKEEAPKPEVAKPEPPKAEAPKVEAPKPAASQSKPPSAAEDYDDLFG